MIRNFRSKLAEDVFNGVNSRYSRKLPSELHKRAVIFKWEDGALMLNLMIYIYIGFSYFVSIVNLALYE